MIVQLAHAHSNLYPWESSLLVALRAISSVLIVSDKVYVQVYAYLGDRRADLTRLLSSVYVCTRRPVTPYSLGQVTKPDLTDLLVVFRKIR